MLGALDILLCKWLAGMPPKYTDVNQSITNAFWQWWWEEYYVNRGKSL